MDVPDRKGNACRCEKGDEAARQLEIIVPVMDGAEAERKARTGSRLSAQGSLLIEPGAESLEPRA
jgi:hypothetical protein